MIHLVLRLANAYLADRLAVFLCMRVFYPSKK
jgi:hypothetical protein